MIPAPGELGESGDFADPGEPDGLPWPDPAPLLAEAMEWREGLPERIGRYAISGILGEGGMGVVYCARQEHPARDVALKVLHPGRYGPSLARRFEREVEALGRLEHRGIARLYEAGEDSLGGARLPYFAMELVDGEPITAFAVERGLPVADRLRLLVEICEAVEYANARGIVHRDLKPGNVLVTRDGQPKVLDFGIARVAAGDVAMASQQTETGQILGTLGYMSPEQVEGDPRRIDAQSDVYALGVIGYELLTGRLPLDVRQKTLADAARTIRDEDPLSPSDFDRTFAGDVDAILLTALEKEKARRYPSVAALAADLVRFLHDRPVLARAPTLRDTVRRLVRRHRAAALALSVILVTLVVATAVSIWFALGESSQRKLAERRAEETERVARFQSEMLQGIDVEAMGRGVKDRYREQVAAALARDPIGDWQARRSRTDEEVRASLAEFDAMVAGTQGADVARRVLDEYVLTPAARTLEARGGDPPLVRAQFHVAIGAAYRALGLFDAAESHLRSALELRIAALGRDHVDVADGLNHLAVLLNEKGDAVAAEPLLLEALEIDRRYRGPEDPATIRVLVNLAVNYRTRGDDAKAEKLYREVLATARARLGDRHEIVAGTLDNLGVLLLAKGSYAEAEAVQREAIAIRRQLGDGPAQQAALAGSLNNLALLVSDAGELAESEALLRESLELDERYLGLEDPRTLTALRHLASTLQSAGKLEEAEALQLRAIEIGRKLYGDADPEIARNLSLLGLVRKERGDLAGAEPLLRDTLAILQSRVDPDPEHVGLAMNNLATLLHAKGDLEGAEPLFHESIAAMRKARGNDHPDLATLHNNLGAMLRDRRDFAAAEPLFREAVRLFRLMGESSVPLGSSLSSLARVLAGQGDHAGAEPFYRESLAMLEREPAAGAERIALVRTWFASSQVALGRHAEAEALLSSAYAAAAEAASERARTAAIQGSIALYESWEALEPGRGHAEHAAEWRSKL